MEGNDRWWSCRRGDVKDTVGLDVEGDFDLTNTRGCWWDTGEIELAEEFVVLGAGTFTLVDGDERTELVGGGGGGNIGLLGQGGAVTLNGRSEDTERQRTDVEEKDLRGLLRGVTGQDGSLVSSRPMRRLASKTMFLVGLW